MTDQAPENTGRTESAAPESRRRSVAKRFGAVLGPLFLFVGLPVALRTLLERVPWSGFEQILAADAERTGRGEPAVWPSVGKYDSANAYLTLPRRRDQRPSHARGSRGARGPRHAESGRGRTPRGVRGVDLPFGFVDNCEHLRFVDNPAHPATPMATRMCHIIE